MIPAFPRDPWGRDLRGQLQHVTFESERLQGNPLGDPASRPLLAYTPPGWPDGGPYTSVWVLQGFTGQVDAWTNRQAFDPTVPERIDQAMAQGVLPPCVAVFPDAWSSYGGSQFVDSAGVGAYRSYLCDELVPWATAALNLKPSREARGLLGKSSGGYGAVMMALERTEVWGGFAALAPDAAFEYGYLPDFPLAWRGLKRFDGRIRDFWIALRAKDRMGYDDHAVVNTVAMAACYSPGPDGEPQLPFSLDDGRLLPHVWDRWLTFDPVRALPTRLHEARGLRALSIECGNRDQFRLDVGSTMLHRQLEGAGIAHRFELFEGTHDALQARYPAAMAYLLERLD